MNWFTKYIGIPFVDNGRSFNGCDCGGLAYLIFKEELKRDLPCFDRMYSAYDNKSTGEILQHSVNKFFKKVNSPTSLSLAVFGRKYFDYHVGVFIDKERIIHCKDGEHAKVQYIDQLNYYCDFRGAYALK